MNAFKIFSRILKQNGNRDAALSRSICLKSADYNKVQPEVATKWSAAVKEAEKVVGYPTSFLNLRWLLNDEIANVAIHLRKLIGTNHPLLAIVKKQLFNNNNQAWALVVLLLSKTGGIKPEIPEVDYDLGVGILHSQRVLAEVTELIRTIVLIHTGLLNIEPGVEFSDDLNFGNKIALLSGDYLLSKSFHDLACIKNHDVNEIISSTLRDFVESKFLGTRDRQNEPLPAKPKLLGDSGISHPDNKDYGPYKIKDILGNSKDEWVLRNILDGANLLGKACQATLILGGHKQDFQDVGYLFGKHLALAWQAKLDYNSFVTKENGNFSLVSAPVMLHLSKDASMYEEIEKGFENVGDCDYKKIRNIILDGTAVEDTKELYHEYATRAKRNLHQFEDSSARMALENIVTSM